MIPHKNIIKVILACASWFFFTSCWKDKTTIHHIDAGLLKHFNYQVGTYWIYRDSVTGNVDSFAVENNVKTTDPTGLKNTCLESVNIKICQYHNGLKNDTITWKIGMVYNEFNFIYHYYSNVGQVYGSRFLYPFNVIYPYLNIRGIEYNNISLDFYIASYEQHFFYINQDAGPIKLKFSDPRNTSSTTLELINYHIVI